MIADSAIRPINTTNTFDAWPEYWRKAGTRRMAYIGIRNSRQAITGPPRVSIMPRMLGLKVATAQQLRIMNNAVARFSQLAEAKAQNLSILSYLANHFSNPTIAFAAPLIAFVAISKSFLGHYIGASEGLKGLVVKSLSLIHISEPTRPY